MAFLIFQYGIKIRNTELRTAGEASTRQAAMKENPCRDKHLEFDILDREIRPEHLVRMAGLGLLRISDAREHVCFPNLPEFPVLILATSRTIRLIPRGYPPGDVEKRQGADHHISHPHRRAFYELPF